MLLLFGSPNETRGPQVLAPRGSLCAMGGSLSRRLAAPSLSRRLPSWYLARIRSVIAAAVIPPTGERVTVATVQAGRYSLAWVAGANDHWAGHGLWCVVENPTYDRGLWVSWAGGEAPICRAMPTAATEAEMERLAPVVLTFDHAGGPVVCFDSDPITGDNAAGRLGGWLVHLSAA